MLTSTYTLIHAFQSVRTNRLACMDHGVHANKKIYGQPIPPEFNLNNVKVPTAIHYSDGDLTTKTEDLERLYKKLPNKMGLISVSCDQVTHAELMYSIKGRKCCYNNVLKHLA